MLNTGDGTIRPVEPLLETRTHMNVEMSENALTAPLAKVMQLATVQVYQNNQLLRTIAIEDDVQIDEANIFQRFFIWLKHILPFFSSEELKVKIYPLN
jgi:D-alanyl-D-alanine carboxypeptidase (penicillin-binding protein 5/6)